jgi:hypothetical protein
MHKTRSFAVLLSLILGAQPAFGQASDQKIYFDPRVVTMPRPAAPPAASTDQVEISKFDGAANVDVDSATFDQFAQMVRRFNALERKIDKLSEQNAVLSQQLAEALRAIEHSQELMLAHARTTNTTPKGITVGAAVGLTCSMVSELLYIEKGSFLGFNPPEGGGNRPC